MQLNPVLLGSRLGDLGVKVRDDVHGQIRERREVVEVLLTDDTCADDGDTHGPVVHRPPAAVSVLTYLRDSAMPSKMSLA